MMLDILPKKSFVYDTQPDAALESINDYIRWCASVMCNRAVYFGHGTDNAFDEARALVLSALSLPFETPKALLTGKLTELEKTRILEWLQARVDARKPLAYLTREILFADLPFYVDERVLVPRSPFAELIDQHFSPWWDGLEPPNAILDLCAGSGCIGIAAGLEMDAPVTLADISDEALAVAHINAQTYREAIDIESIQSDLFDSLTGQYDLILTNPPYVDADEIESMPAEYHHEPMLGLASGEDGLDHIIQILQQAPEFMTERGLLFAEVGASDYALEMTYPELPLTWIELEHGGRGIFMIAREDLLAWREMLS